MQITPKGFTLVELMIVIAIIGILAVALFPSLASHLARGRDTERLTDVSSIRNATATFLIDKLYLPNPITSVASGSQMCVSSGALIQYLSAFPLDPIANRSFSCGIVGAYGYGTGTLSTAAKIFTISVVFEGINAGNTGSVTSYQGGPFADDLLKVVDGFSK